MSNEFSYLLNRAEVGHPRNATLTANADQRAAIAARLGLEALDNFVVEAAVSAVAGGVAADGRISAAVVQACAATGLPVAARIDEAFALRWLETIAVPEGDEEDIEISADDCDILPLEGDRIDLGEAAVQTLSLALNPFPRHPDADRILAEKGVLSEAQAGPFAALAALRARKDG